MSQPEPARALARPHRYLWWMSVFLIITSSIIAILGVPSDQLQNFFNANRGLNGLILLVLLLGIGMAYWQVMTLGPEIRWVNRTQRGSKTSDPRNLRLLPPLTAALARRDERGREGETAVRSALESVGSRLDESRDVLRYMVGLLVFLGLLGTFWGLLQTISSIGDLIAALDPTGAEGGSLLANLIENLQKPLAGMGVAFSSSLFGLGSSLILGFLDLQTGHAQTRFYNELEDWVANLAPAAGSVSDAELAHPPSMAALASAIDDLSSELRHKKAPEQGGGSAEAQPPAPGNPFRG